MVGVLLTWCDWSERRFVVIVIDCFDCDNPWWQRYQHWFCESSSVEVRLCDIFKNNLD
jgi:hypothetical protein